MVDRTISVKLLTTFQGFVELEHRGFILLHIFMFLSFEMEKRKIIQIIVDIDLKREIIFLLIFSTEKAEQYKTRTKITKKLRDII